MRNLKLALLSTVCLLPVMALTIDPALAAKAGVTAAVNPQAVGTPPGGGVRTIVLGQDVVTNEKIDTTGGGLVQILLADGTTFTVGPNSSLTIDKFVYDPDANTAQVTASLAKGVFRFIGGRTSKTDGGVTINTPVGTVGIRGAVADISLTPNGQELKAQIDLLFGKEITLSGPGGLIDRIYKAGYSILIGADGKAKLVPTPPGSAGSIQDALAGKPGEHGGTGDVPGDGDVADSGVPGTNSDKGLPLGYTPPDLEAIELATIDFFDTHQDAKDILDNQTLATGGFAAGFFDVSDIDSSGGIAAVTSGDFTDSSIGFGSNSAHLTGEVHYGDQLLDVQLAFDGTGDATLRLPRGNPFVVSNLTNTVTPQPSAALCTTCSFIRWGYWQSDFHAAGTTDGNPSGDVYARGTWVNGAITDTAAFDQYADAHSGMTATYNGRAQGYAYEGSDGAHIADGDMELTYDMSSRNGWLDISNFDGNHEISGSILGNESGAAFAGQDSGDGSSFTTSGAFVNNGAQVAGGVIGNFAAQQGSWVATGVYGGTYTSSSPTPP